MSMLSPYGKYPGCTKAFSLIELLVVLAIIAILIGISAPSISGVMRGYQLETAGQVVVNQLTLARQTALSGNRAVQVWFYQLPDNNQPFSATPTVYRAMQAFAEGDPVSAGSSALKAITKPVFLPSPVIFSTTLSPNAVSPLLTSVTATSGNGSAVVLPGYQQNFNYVVLRFKSNGSTNLDSASSNLTMVVENDKADTSTGLPRNYRTLSIDPIIGTVRTYRP